MGVKLLILSWWTPQYLIRKELENISDKTTSTLKTLIHEQAKEETEVTDSRAQHSTSIQEQRAIMAQTHVKMVETLENALGYENAVKLGREALFLVGQEVGRQSREALGVADNPKDLNRAAKILYRVLGIQFHLEWLDNSNARAIIDHCALAEHYSQLTCEVLSATDEGVINGLLPDVTMKFKEYMTSGCKKCKADIHFNEKRKV